MTKGERGLVIRSALSSDCPALATLATQLGYPSSAEDLGRRLAGLPADDVVLVAELDGVVAGWMHLSVVRTLVVDARAEVRALVVDESYRGRGMGRQLMAAAEAFARERGLDSVRLTSATQRHDAHRFYEALGYGAVKTQVVLSRALEGSARRD